MKPKKKPLKAMPTKLSHQVILREISKLTDAVGILWQVAKLHRQWTEGRMENLKSEQNRLRFILEDSKEAREDNLPTLQRLRELMQSLESGQAMLNERISSLYEFIEKSHDEMHAMVNGSDIPESPFLDDSL